MGFSDVSTKLLIVRSLEPIVRQGAQSPTDQLAIYFHHLICKFAGRTLGRATIQEIMRT